METIEIKDLVDYLQSHSDYIKAQTLIRNIPDLKRDSKLRIIVNKLRQQGVPIISSSNGYKYTEDKEEVYIYAALLKNRYIEMKKAHDGLIDWINKDK